MSAGPQQVLRGRFEVLEEIGEGGFARVYAARETTTGQRVALKVLKDGFQNDPEIIERFRREVFAVASISSPHVVGLKDFGISGDEFFIAMEFVEGPTLREVIEQHDWSADSVHTLIGQVAAALEAAHAQNIVHRDLKPENVMLVSGPGDTLTVKVLDFGLAKLAELERNLGLEPLTRVGMCFGTPHYMSPELIYGKPVDHLVDLFALGVMSYEMIAGRRPWDGEAAQAVMVAVAKTPLPPITRVHASMARRLEVINRFFARALAKKKEDRPQDATVFFEELSMAIYGERRALRVPKIHEAPAELTAIHTRLSLRPRADETQIDMSPAGHGAGLGGDKTVEFSSMPQDDGTTMMTAQDRPAQQSVSNRSGKLASAWIPSIPSSPSLEEPVSSVADETQLQPSIPREPAGAATSPMKVIDERASQPPGVHRSRPTWMLFILFGGLVVLMIVAASIGFLIGRGR